MPSVEQVREFKVLTGVFSAEFGRGAGVVSVSTKSGANQLRGTASSSCATTPSTPAISSSARPCSRMALSRIRCRRSIGTSSGARSAGRSSSLDSTTGTAVLLLRRLRRDQGAARPDDGQYRSHGRHARRRFQRLPGPERQRDSDLRPADHPPSTRRAAIRARSVSEQHHSADRLNPVGRNIGSVYPLPNTEAAASTTTSRLPIVRSPITRSRAASITSCRTATRSSCGSITAVPPRCAAGPGELLPADAAGGGRAIRSGPVRRRHSEHAIDHARHGGQLLEGAQAAAGQRAPHRLCQHRAVHEAVGLRPQRLGIPRHPRHQHQRDHDRAAEHRHHELHRPVGRTGVPAREPQPAPLPNRRRARLAEGPAPAEVRVSTRGSPAVADDPRQHAERDQLRHAASSTIRSRIPAAPASPTCSSATSTTRAGGSCSRSRTSGWSSRPRSCRTTSRSATGSPSMRACATRSSRPDRKEQPARQLRLRPFRPGLRRRERHQPQRQQEDALSQLRAAPGPDVRPDQRCPHGAAHRLRHHLLPEPVRGRQPQSPQCAVRHLAERAARDQPARLQPACGRSPTRFRRLSRSSR